MLSKFGWGIPVRFVRMKLFQLPKMGTQFDGGKSHQSIDNAKKYSLHRYDKKIAPLYEQDTSKRRIGLSLARWIGWACIAINGAVAAIPCTQPPISDNTRPEVGVCECNDPDLIYLIRTVTKGEIDLALAVAQCADEYDTTCATPSTNNTVGTHYYKNTTELSDYFSCDWTPETGYSNPQNYTPSLPPPEFPAGGAAATISPVLVYVALFGLLVAVLFLVGILIYVLRKKIKVKTPDTNI